MPSRPRARRTWTYDEFAAESLESNFPTELWDGEIIVSADPRPTHQRIAARTWRYRDEFVIPRKLGEAFISPVDVVFSGRKAVQPDVVYVSDARKSMVEEDCIRGVPDLLIEVISEGTWRCDRGDKKALYEQAGVAEYWLIDPDSRLIEVFTLAQGSYQSHARGMGTEKAGSKLLAGLKVSFEQLEA